MYNIDNATLKIAHGIHRKFPHSLVTEKARPFPRDSVTVVIIDEVN